MSSSDSTADSRLVGIPEFAEEIVTNAEQWKAISHASRDFMENHGSTFENFLLTDEQAMSHDLSVGGTLEERKEEIRSRQFPFVKAFDLELTGSASVEQKNGTDSVTNTVFDAFQNLEQLLYTFPNLKRVWNVPVDVIETRYRAAPRRQKGTLRFGENGQLTLIPNETVGLGQYVVPSFPEEFPSLANARTEHDVTVKAMPSESMYDLLSASPYTRSIAFQGSVTKQDKDDPVHAAILQRAHIRNYGAPVQSMMFELACSNTSRSVSPYTDLATVLYNEKLIGASGTTRGATRVGYTHKDTRSRPTAIACLEEISELAPPGVRHVSFGVIESFDLSRLDDANLKVPKSLRSISLEHHHNYFPNKRYLSDIKKWIEHRGVEVRFACNKPTDAKRATTIMGRVRGGGTKTIRCEGI